MPNENEKLYTVEDLLNITAIILGKNNTELVALTKDIDLTNFDTLKSEIKAISVSERNAMRKAEFDRGFKKSKTQTEETIKELFPNENFEGKDGKEPLVSDILAAIKEKTAVDKSKQITAEQAYNVPEVQQKIKELKAIADTANAAKFDFEKYKTNQIIKQYALDVMEKKGAVFSTDPTRKAIQMEALEASLSKHIIKIFDGKPVVMDSEGINPKYDAIEGKTLEFDSFVQQISPVDFNTTVHKQDKTTYTPQITTSTTNSYGYTDTQLKSMDLYEEFSKKNKEGKTAEADFLYKEMEKRVLAEEAEIKKT